MTDWQEVGRRVERSREALAGKVEGVDYVVLAHTDWADEFVPTIVKWLTGPKVGQVDSFSESSAPPREAPRRAAAIRQDLTTTEAQMDQLRANYKVPLEGGTRSRTTTFNARMDDLAERRQALRKELAEAERREASGSAEEA